MDTDSLAYKTGLACYINEAGLYSLILSSKLPSAKAFRKWVTKEVLPSIRKECVYKLEQSIKEYEDINWWNRLKLSRLCVSYAIYIVTPHCSDGSRGAIMCDDIIMGVLSGRTMWCFHENPNGYSQEKQDDT